MSIEATPAAGAPAGDSYKKRIAALLSCEARVAVAGATEEDFASLVGVAEVVREDGRPLGFFLPLEEEDLLLYLKALVLHDPEEIKRRKEDGSKGRTTREVIDDLRSRGAP
jgi:hypothetical protein